MNEIAHPVNESALLHYMSATSASEYPAERLRQDSASNERMTFWRAMCAKRNPVCDIFVLDNMEQYQVRNLIQSTFHSGTRQFLLEQELSNVMEAGDSLVLRNLRHETRFVFQLCWDNYSSQHILGLPSLQFETLQGACARFYLYLRSLQDDGSLLASFRRRTAQVWFWLLFDTFREYSTQKDNLLHTPPGCGIDSMAAIQNQILTKAYPGYAYAPWGEACRRAMRNHLQLGFNWWRLACCLGHGVLLIASRKVVRLLETAEHLVDALINYAQNAYPGVLGLFHLCSPVVTRFMYGRPPGSEDIIKVQRCISLVATGRALARSYCLPWKWSNPGPLAMANAAFFLMRCENEGVLCITHLSE